jgi:hypothetical protein
VPSALVDEVYRQGIAGRNGGWSARQKKILGGLFYILVSVGKDRGHDKFFILSQDETNKLIDDWRAAHPHGSARGEGISFRKAAPFEDRWQILADWCLLH